MRSYKFTIFTPCYNGEKTIYRVFKSVASQTYLNFEWIIINDGSSDNSDKVIKKLISENPLIKEKIIYLIQDNQGKHISWNKALSIATGDIWVPADCDDSFIPESLEYFNKKCNEIPNFLNSNFSGINVCCQNPQSGCIIGSPFPYNGMDSNNLELEYKYKIRGEHWGCIRIDLLRAYTFPKIRGHFYNENYLWFSFSKDKYLVRCYNDALRNYYFEETSLCNNKALHLDKDRVLMFLDYYLWLEKKMGLSILKYSIKGWVDIHISILKCLIKLLICYLK